MDSNESAIDRRDFIKTTSAAGLGLVASSRAVAPLFAKYCITCHSGNEAEGELKLDFVSLEQVQDKLSKDHKVFERIAGRRDVNSSVERVQLKDVMMQGPVGRRAGASVNGSSHADLLASVSKFLTLRNAFWKSCGSRRNIPDDPMHLIVRGAIASEVVHVQHERLRAGRRVGPRHRR